MSVDWKAEFRRIYDHGVAAWKAGRKSPATMFTREDAAFLATMDCLPPKVAEVDGIAWLPRLIVKARLKLRGEMPDDLMYGCGGDRPFLEEMNMDLPGFLELVWESGDDDRRILEAVKQSAGRA